MTFEAIDARCRTIKGVHIPGCMGCAAMGHDRCTCAGKPTTIETLERRIDRLEGALETILVRLEGARDREAR